MSSNNALVHNPAGNRYLSIQIRQSYMAGQWGGYGYVGVVECDTDGPDPDSWLPIRNTTRTRVVYKTNKFYCSEKALSDGIDDAAAWVRAHAEPAIVDGRQVWVSHAPYPAV